MTDPTIRALYIDDEPVLLEITKAFLELEGGIEVGVAESGVEALVLLRTTEYDVIVSDYQMPGMDGIKLLKEMRAAGNTSPFILFTGKGREDVAMEALNLGADFYIQKGGNPNVQFGELRNAIVKLAQKNAAERALLASERKYRELVESSNSIILRVGPDGIIRYVNEYAQTFFGYDLDELVGRSVLETITPMVDDLGRDQVLDIDVIVRNHIENASSVSQNVKRSGEKVWIAWNNRLINNEDGEVEEIMSIGTDMTALYLAERRLKSSFSLLMATLESSRDGILVTGSDNLPVTNNKQLLSMWGVPHIPRAEEVDLLASALGQLKDPQAFRDRIHELNAAPEMSSSDVLEFKDGRAYEMVTRPQASEDMITGRFWTFHDITERRRAEIAIKASESRLRAVFDNTSFGIALVAPSGEFIEVNPAFQAMTGYTRDELVTMRTQDVTPLRFQGDEAALFDRLHEGQLEERQIEKHLLAKDGREVPVKLTVTTVRDEFGELRYALGMTEDMSEKMMVEDALKVKQEELSIITMNAQDLITRVDHEGRIIFASPSSVRLLGYTPEELMGKTHLDLTHPDHRDEIIRRTAEVTATKGPWKNTARYIRRDGRCVWIENYGTVLVNEDGEATGMVLNSRDITEAMSNALALRDRDDRLRLITDNMKDLISLVDRDGTILYTSPSVKSVLGYDPQERIGTDCLELIHPEDRERTRQRLRAAIVSGELRGSEFRYLDAEGRYIWLETVGTPLKDANGEVTSVVLSSRDITDRRQAEDELRAAERKFRDIFDGANDSILIIGGDGVVLEANRVACHQLGYDYHELVGLSIANIDSRFCGPHPEDELTAALSGTGGMAETVHVAKDGTKRPVEINCTPIGFGRDRAHLCIARDITDRKEIESRLRESEHLLKETQDTAHIGGYHIDLVSGLSEWTDEAFRICGIDPIRERDRRDEYLKLVLPEDRQLVNQAWWEMPERDVNINFVYRLMIPDGRLRYIHNRGKMELDEEGNIVGIFGTLMDVTDLKLAEEKLKESEMLLAEAQKLSRTGSYRYNLMNWDAKWSEEMFQLLAREPYEGEPSMDEYWSLIHGDDLPGLKRAMRRAVETASSFDVSFRARVDGRYRNFQSTGRAVAAADGTPLYIIGTMSDITERMQAEEDRARMERKFRDIFDYANDIILILDPELRLLEVNVVACQRLGYARDDLLLASLPDIVEPSSRPGLRDIAARILGEGELLFESSHLSKSGAIIPVEMSCKVMEIDGRKAILSVARDITERKDAERRLMESRRLLAEAEKACKMGSFRVNLLSGTVQASDELYAIVGLERGQGLMMEHLFRSMHPEDRPALAEAVRRVQRDRGQVEIEYRLITKEGSIRHVFSKTRPEYSSDGQMISIFGTIIDITERKRAEEAAKLAELKIALLGDITRHDVHNKVTALTGYLQLAERRSLDQSARDLIAKARLAADSITHQMAFAREYQSLGQHEATWIDLGEAMRNGTSTLDLGMVRLSSQLDGFEVFADPMLEKVFHNLVENSVRYGKTTTHIEIAATVTTEGLRIVCQDDGVGIADHDRAKLFDWEFRGRRGHGLHLIKEVLRISDMSIQETGESGRGSRFEIMVPPGRYRGHRESCSPPAAVKAPS